eukprot:1817861-Prymnesium_polylepis.1
MAAMPDLRALPAQERTSAMAAWLQHNHVRSPRAYRGREAKVLPERRKASSDGANAMYGRPGHRVGVEDI